MCQSTLSHPENLNDLQARFSDENVCKEYLAQLRWKGKPVCPYCGNNGKTYKIVTGYKCSNPECYKKFSVLKGTIFEESKIPLRVWFVAIYIVTAHKKGYASHQLARDLDVTQKTAWFMLQRIRYFMAEKTLEAPLKGIVEVDETYIGGAEKNKHANKKTAGTQGRSTKTKAPDFGMIERGGRVVAVTVTSTTAKILLPIIKEHVSIVASIMTDEFRAYMNLHHQYQHGIVRHGEGQYKSGEAQLTPTH
ncbi:IS1595 family transposase [Fibrisoma montanum]|uniref:IS1595 family transposase n=1 Tax=Fibrisoma montanum TaxID=2305895 RepID=UPI0021D2A4D2|nr:IS1595 family transposase [Fibrisoma montanum]